jgi:hypothetical protein
MPQVHHQIGDRVIDGDCDGEYDTDGGAVVVVRWDEDPHFGVRLGFDDPHCEDFSPKDFYPSGKKCWRVRAA